ncbi:hypothetical protein J2T13_004925 [Paenibacillus sp. DS2015]
MIHLDRGQAFDEEHDGSADLEANAGGSGRL